MKGTYLLKALLSFIKSLYFHVLYTLLGIYKRHYKWVTLRLFNYQSLKTFADKCFMFSSKGQLKLFQRWMASVDITLSLESKQVIQEAVWHAVPYFLCSLFVSNSNVGRKELSMPFHFYIRNSSFDALLPTSFPTTPHTSGNLFSMPLGIYVDAGRQIPTFL